MTGRGARRTIASSREIDTMFRAAKRSAHPLLIVLSAHTPEGRGRNGRVAFIAGKKLGGAVWRNRARRVLRGAMQRAGGPWNGWDVVLIARADTTRAHARELDEALRSVLRRSGVVS